jgi:hypothetical protein
MPPLKFAFVLACQWLSDSLKAELQPAGPLVLFFTNQFWQANREELGSRVSRFP